MRRICRLFSLPLLMALPLAGQCVERAENGVGEVLIYPLVYTGALNGSHFDSLLRVNNISAQAIAVRAVLRQGDTGTSVLEWTLLMGPHDRWSAAVTRQDGQIAIITNDESCLSVAAEELAIPASVDQFWLELYEVGGLADGSLTNCDALSQVQDLSPAAGRLRGDGQLVDVIAGLSLQVPPVALRALDMVPATLPLEAGAIDFSLAAPEAVIDGVQTTWSNGVDAVSAALLTVGVQSDFTAVPALNGTTDLILTLPTRHLYGAGEAPFAINSHQDHEEEGQEIVLAAADEDGRRVDSYSVFPKCTPVPPPATQAGPVISSSQANFYIDTGAGPVFSLADTEAAGTLRDGGTCGDVYVTLGRSWGVFEGMVGLNFSAFSMTSNEGITVTGLPVLVNSLATIANGTLVDDSTGDAVRANYGLVNTVSRFPAVVEVP